MISPSCVEYIRAPQPRQLDGLWDSRPCTFYVSGIPKRSSSSGRIAHRHIVLRHAPERRVWLQTCPVFLPEPYICWRQPPISGRMLKPQTTSGLTAYGIGLSYQSQQSADCSNCAGTSLPDNRRYGLQSEGNRHTVTLRRRYIENTGRRD